MVWRFGRMPDVLLIEESSGTRIMGRREYHIKNVWSSSHVMERLKWVTFYRLQEKWCSFCFTFTSILRSGHWVDGPHAGLLWSLPCTLLLSRSMILHSTNCFSSHLSFSLFSPAIQIHVHYMCIRKPEPVYCTDLFTKNVQNSLMFSKEVR